VTYTELKKSLDPQWRGMSRATFVGALTDVYYWGDPKTRVGGPVGKGRITVKRALILLGELKAVAA